ncbi:hypothetical protein BH11MYX3_BH11MYX3_02930 [soil metagenome]
MSGPKRNPDKLNTIGVVVVGICGAVLVYVSIVALQAFYMNDTSEIQTMADYGGNDTSARSLRTAQVHNITEVGSNPAAPPKANEPAKAATYRVNIEQAMKLVVESAKVDPSSLVPAVGRSDKATIQPIFGRPQPVAQPTPAPAPATGTGSGSGSAADSPPAGGAGSASGSAPTAPTGGLGQGGSAGTGGAGSGTTAAPAPPINLPNTTGTGAASKIGAGSGSAVPTGSSINKGNAP